MAAQALTEGDLLESCRALEKVHEEGKERLEYIPSKPSMPQYHISG